MSDVRGDIRFAWRSLRRQPGFLTVTLATLALGIGAATAMFTVVNGVLFRPLPFTDPSSLAVLQIEGKRGGLFPLPDADFLALRAGDHDFERIAVFTRTSFALIGRGTPEVVHGAWVSGDFFTVLGVPPQLGRLFSTADDAPGAPDQVVLTHAFWTRRFGADPSVVGRTVRLDDVACTIVGIASPDMTLPGPNLDLWRNLVVKAPPRRGPFYLTGLVRLRPGKTTTSALPGLTDASRAIVRQYGGPADWHFQLVPLEEATVGDARTPLYLLMAAVLLLMLIAVANVANLLLARASARQRELAVRTALGASRRRIAAQLLTEAALLGAAGGALGVALAVWLTHAMLALADTELPRAAAVRIDAPVLLFAMAISAAAALLFGGAPALQSSDGRADHLRGDHRAGDTRTRRRLQRAFVVAEIALALVLSVGAGLLVRSLMRLQHVDAGFDANRLLTFQIDLPSARYHGDDASRQFYARLIERVEALPGVRSAAVAVSLPPDQLTVTDNFTAEGKTYAQGESAPVGAMVVVSDAYFRTLHVPLLAGRLFDARDRPDGEPVVIVSRTLADHYYPNGDAVGRRFRTGGPERPNNPWMRVIGIVGDVRYDGLAAAPEPAYYVPFSQNPWAGEYVVVRTAVDPEAIVPPLRAAVWSLDRDLPIEKLRTMDDLMQRATSAPRFRTALLAGFGALGLVLAIVGVYGVMSYTVSRRMHEMGVRAALGAQRGDLLRLVIRDAGVLTALGLGTGLALAWWAARLTRTMLFGVAPGDPATFAAVAVLLAAAALVASWIPARRASRADPSAALRQE